MDSNLLSMDELLKFSIITISIYVAFIDDFVIILVVSLKVGNYLQHWIIFYVKLSILSRILNFYKATFYLMTFNLSAKKKHLSTTFLPINTKL